MNRKIIYVDELEAKCNSNVYFRDFLRVLPEFVEELSKEELSKVYCIFSEETDGYTYSYAILRGVQNTKEKANEFVSYLVQYRGYDSQNLFVREVEIGWQDE